MSALSGLQGTSGTHDHTMQFPLESLTEAQRTTFIEYLEAREETGMNLFDPIWLTLLLVCERPGMMFNTLIPPTPVGQEEPSDPPITKEHVTESFGLRYRIADEHALYVSRTNWRLEFLPTNSTFSDAYHRRMGCFLGYPSVDVEDFIQSDLDWKEPRDFVDDGIFEPEEVVFSKFTPQGQKDTIGGYERAINRGKKNWQTVIDSSMQWELPELKEYANRLYQQSLVDCSGFSFVNLS